MSDVLIDLGEVPRQRAAAVASRAPFPVRVVLGLLAAVLLTTLTGAVARTPPADPVIIAARLGDALFPDGDRLHVVSAGQPIAGSAGGLARTVSTYAVPAGKLIVRTYVGVFGGITGVWESGGTTVVTYQVSTSGDWGIVAVTTGTDRVLWRRVARFIGISPDDRLVLVETADAELAVDLTTGRTRWSAPNPADGFTAGAGAATPDGFPRWLVTVTDSGRLEARDARTGSLLGAVSLTRRPGRASSRIWPVGDLVMVDTFGSGFDAFRLPTLRPVWRTSVDLAHSWMQTGCGALICTFQRQWGMTVIDPATGRALWSDDRWAFAEQAGRHLLATPQEEDAPVSVLDPATGRLLGDFGDWQALGPTGDGLRYGVLTGDGYRILYGVLDPATRRARILGAADRVSNGCRTTGAVLVCRLIDASIGVWPLR